MEIIRVSTISLSLNILLKGQLKYINQYYSVLGISSGGALLDEVSKREGVPVFAIKMERGVSPIKDLFSLIKLYKKFKKEKPLIVHSITPKAGLLSMLAGKMANVPIRMHTFTGLIFPSKSGLFQKILIKMDQLLCWSATNIYPEGKGVKNDLLKYKITSKPLNILANGNVNGLDTDYFSIDHFSTEERFNLRKSLGINATDFVFIFVGRLVGDKGINELIKSFKEICNSSDITSNPKLLLVGALEMELDPIQSETLKEIKINSDIISVGFQKDVRPYFSISDTLVFPSYREGFPNVVMQAGAMELPSIVSNINGCNEIIIEGKNGTIIPVKDSKSIEKAMLRFISDSSYLQSLKNNARHMIESRYKQKIVWEALIQEYDKLLKNKGLK